MNILYKQQGQTFIEVILFVVIIGIVMAGSMTAFQTLLRYSVKPGQMLVASQLADARMNLIILQRRVNGVATLVDPCASGSLDACAGLNAYAASGGYVVSSVISAQSGGVRTATVTVSGTADATNVVRFVQ